MEGGEERRRPRVLVIDDERPLLRAVARVLGEEYEVVSETDGAQAIGRIASGERFDAIVCDVIMPILDGAQFLDRLRKCHPAVADTVVFMTGGVMTMRALAFLDRVPNARLFKPFHPRELKEAVQRTVAGARRRSA
jgi:CheY-like chemotaxis protein